VGAAPCGGMWTHSCVRLARPTCGRAADLFRRSIARCLDRRPPRFGGFGDSLPASGAHFPFRLLALGPRRFVCRRVGSQQSGSTPTGVGRPTMEEPWKEVDNLPFDIPCRIRFCLTGTCRTELYSRSVVGSMKPVPEDFLAWAKEAAGKRYDGRLLREMGQREAARTTSKFDS
jgi:hypothetical protein